MPAGVKQFTGAMLNDLVDKMTTLVTSMGSMVTALSAINTGVGMSIQAGKVKASENNLLTLCVATDIFVNSTSNTEVGRVLCYATGSLRVKASIKGANSGYPGALAYAKNGGASVDLYTDTTGAFVAKSADISVSAGDVIVFYGHGINPGAYVYVQGSSLKVGYDLINVAVDGYIVKG